MVAGLRKINETAARLGTRWFRGEFWSELKTGFEPFKIRWVVESLFD